MEAQNYSNHKQYVFMFHVVLFFLLVVTVIGSFVNLFESIGDHSRIYSASLITTLSIGAVMLFFFLRSFSTSVQDRAIRAEESLRHFALTGKLLDPNLTIKQIVALRFASDAEFVALAKKAVDENLSNDDIKKAVKNWRADYHRV
jgi:hypothetical protein